MSDLYTSLTQLKMAMNGGTLPPMTPLTPKALEVVKPEFTIGMGALCEDAVKGLQCPVCGVWRHKLSLHITTSHRGMGGCTAVRQALAIPQSVRLVSAGERERCRKMQEDPARKAHAMVLARIGATELGKRAVSKKAKAAQARERSFENISARNMRNYCEAQLRNRFWDLMTKIGRSPSATDFRAEYGDAVVQYVITHYKSWNNAKTHFGISVYEKSAGRRLGRKSIDSLDVLEGLRAWHEAHGKFPTCDEAHHCAGRVPFIHSRSVTLRAFKCETWAEAMRRAASMLKIYGGKYGIPEHLKPQETAA